MVGRTPSLSRELIGSSISSLKYGGSGDIGSKLGLLGRLRDQLLVADSVLLLEFLSTILDLLSDSFSPVRKFVTQLIGQIGLKHLELIPEIIPALIDVLKDDTPAVARQAISSGIDIFRYALVNVAIQGLYSSEFNESLKSSWACVLKFKDEIYSMAFTAGSDSRRLPALKFVASVVLLYTSDPNGSLAPPSDPISEGNFEEFNASWIRSGHPILNVGDLSVEAGRSLSLLLDQLRSPSMKSHSNLMLIVLIKSLSAIARKRSVFYGRILPVLLGLDLSTSSRKGIHLAGVNHALKNSFEACLDCSHPGSVPWRDRLVSALAENKVGRPIQGKDLDDGRRAVWRGDLNVAQVQEEEKPFIAFDTKHVNAGRKRTADMPHLTEDESLGKRARSTPERLEESEHDTSGKLDSTSTAPTPSESDAVSEPVQQLVAMFGALVAQGEKAVASLEILISSISADLLAEVVLANMRNIPPKLPRPEEDEGPHIDTQLGKIESVTHLKYLSLVLTDVLSQSNSAGNATGVEELHHSVASNLEQTEEEKPHVMLVDNSAAYDGSTLATQPATATEHVSGEDIPSVMEISYKDITSEANEPELVENGIPGLVLSTQDDGLHENVAIVSEDTADLDDSNQVKFIDLGAVPLELAQSLPSERSEELSPKAEVTDITSINSSTATSVALSSQLILPQMSAPVIQLADEQKDQLQEVAFERIVDAYKQVAIAGGSQIRFSILAHSGMEFPSELDPWKLLKTHILSDYVNHEGHELTLRVLYRLFGEAEEDRDFFSSSTATSVYETFLLQVAEAVRDFFPASDKSLGRLLGEVPYLPKSLLEMLEHLCSPGSRDNDDKELRGGDRVTQGLSTAWSLILLRPPIRDACLKICLKSAVHHLEEVRMKAIRLVANKLYPLPHISGKIEDFAKEMLLSVVSDDHIALIKEADGTHAELQKDEIPSCINQSASSAVSKDISSETHQLPASESIPSSTVAEVQRCMSLYFALCTKKHSLLRQIFDVYEGTSKATKQIIHGQIPLLVRTIGSSRDLLDIISDPPTGSEGLVTQAVSTLTDGTVPSPDLIFSVKRLYNRKLKDVDVLLPILPFLPKDEILLIFPHLVNTPLDKFQVVLSRVLQGSNRSTPVLTPAEAMIAIHRIDPEKDGIPLKKVTDACNACFEQRQIFTQQVIAKVLNQLVEQIPLPLLFMRTVLQAIGAFPALVDFIMEILSRLVSKQIWKYPKLWVGFMKCTLLTKPQSFAVLLQLPPAQLENVLNRTAALKAPLIAHASQPHLRSSLPRSTLVVLGIVSEVQNSTQAQPTQTQNSPAQTQNSPAQTLNSPAQTQNSPAQTQTRTEETQTQTLDTGNSGKEEGADKSKESSTVD